MKKIITKLHENNIKVVIFTTPLNKNCRDNIPLDIKSSFEKLLLDISADYNVPIYFLHDKYDNSTIWNNYHHLTFQNSYQYSDDIAKIILKEINP